MKEVWKDIPGYEGLYQASNMGLIRSLERTIITSRGAKNLKPIQMKLSINSRMYLVVGLRKNKKTKTFKVHQLITMAFLNHKPCGQKLVVDHINEDKLDNRLSNLRLITHRENLSRYKNVSSKYAGVYFEKKSNKWRSRISINNKLISIGSFDCELKAAKAYQDKLKEITGGQ